MLARAPFAALLAACSVAVLLASSASAWGLSGKSSESTQSDRILPTSSTGTPDHVQDHYWWNVKTGTVQWTDPNPVHQTDDGKEYYVDPNTGESTWTKPVDFAWVQAQSEDHGREYYHNTVTQESVWEKPEPLFWKKVATSVPVSTEL